MKNKLIIEELERLRLLMKYNPKQTLSENITLISEQWWKEGLEVLTKLSAKESSELLRSLEIMAKEDSSFFSKMVREDGQVLKTQTEILDAIKAGTLGPQATGSIAKNLFLKGTTQELRLAGAESITSMGKFAKKYQNMTREEIVSQLLRDTKYTESEAELLADTYLKKSKLKLEPVKPEPKPEPKPDPLKPEPKPEPKPDPLKPTEPKKWTGKTWDWIKRNWKKLALGAGALWLLWYWFKDEQKIFPTCLLNLMSEEDLKKSSLGEGEIYVSKLNINDLDKLGGGKFSTNGDFESILGGYEGTWEKEGETFLIVVGGQNYTFECKEKPPIPPIPPPVPPRPEDNKCKTLPMKAGCIDDSGEGIINKIQECLGVAVTGKLDSATIQKLKEKYGVEILDQSTYDKIIKDCYETIDDRKFTEI